MVQPICKFGALNLHEIDQTGLCHKNCMILINDTRGIIYTGIKKSFILGWEHTPLEVYDTLLAVCCHYGQHAKFCSIACKHLKVMQVTNATCCMSHASCHTPHRCTQCIFLKLPKLLKAYCASTVLGITQDPRVFMKLNIGRLAFSRNTKYGSQ